MDSNVLVISIAFAPVVGLLLVRKKLGVLNAAACLVTWGAVVFSAEHGGFSLILSVEPMAQLVEDGHGSFHFFMGDVAKWQSNWMVCDLVYAPLWGCLRGSGENHDLPSRYSATLFPRRLCLVFIYRGAGERITGLIPPRV